MIGFRSAVLQPTCHMPAATPRPRNAAWLLLGMLALAGCHGKVKTAPPPPPPPAVATEVVSVPPPTHPTEPEPQPEVVEAPPAPAPPPPAPRRPPRRRPTPPPPAPTVAVATPPPVDLGQLTTGGEANNAALRQSTEDLLRGQQRRLLALPSPTATAHSDQVERARLFLRQADDAWKALDLEGTRTLATKAKVILDEITQ